MIINKRNNKIIVLPSIDDIDDKGVFLLGLLSILTVTIKSKYYKIKYLSEF